MPKDMSKPNAARRENAERRRADYLTERGWVCVPPNLVPMLKGDLRELGRLQKLLAEQHGLVVKWHEGSATR